MYDHKLALVIMKGKNKQTGDKKERHTGKKNLALDLGSGMGVGNEGERDGGAAREEGQGRSRKVCIQC